MKTYISIFLFTILLSLLPATLLSQDSIQYRKLYLHTDREQYFLGDTIWYKAYYLDGQSNEFAPGLITMYADLINETGNSVLNQVIPIDNGAANGAIDLPFSLVPGNYIIRAFTDFQRRIGEDAFFHKKIKIAKLESFVEGTEESTQQDLTQIDVAFLPEGGILLGGQKNTIGVKIIDAYGSGIPVQGEIQDSKGKSVVAFNTSYKGMASIQFVPLKEETYTASLAEIPDYTHTFENVVEEGIKIEYTRETVNDLSFQVVSNAESLLGLTYYFAISHHGEVIFHKKFVPKNSTFPITVKKNALPAGINRMVLLDEQLLPISERLYFSSNYQINEIKIKTDKQDYETRSKVSLKLTDGKGMDSKSWSNLSLVVVDEFMESKEGRSMNILSWLLIDSELKGRIETPLDYFSSEQGIASATKLDLLMLTQGWSRYIWSKPEEYLIKGYYEEEGFPLSGKVKKVVGNKPAQDGSVELKVYNNDFIHMDEVEIDEEGRFVFKDISFMDTAAVFVQARNKNDRLTFKVSLDPIFNNNPLASTKYLPKEEVLVPRQAELYQKQYDNLQALKEYTLKTGTFYLEEVTITEYKREPDDGHFRIYAKPSNSRKIAERDVGYLTIFDYIQGHFAGLRVTASHEVFIGGASSFTPLPALLLLNGFQIEGDVLAHISVSEIDVVEVLKYASEAGIYGVRGAGGVVAVYTKKGGARDYSDKYLPGTIAEKLVGYSSKREFYSPNYVGENINSEVPDHRIVEFWEPNIFTEKGKASVTFFSSDDISRYKVYVEGITNEGRICLGTAEFEVNKKND